jgi:hypothetical protein
MVLRWSKKSARAARKDSLKVPKEDVTPTIRTVVLTARWKAA